MGHGNIVFLTIFEFSTPCAVLGYVLFFSTLQKGFLNFFSANLVTGFFLWYDFTKNVSLTKFQSMFDIGHYLPTGRAPSECGQWNATDPLHLTRSSSRNSIGKSVNGIGSSNIYMTTINMHMTTICLPWSILD